MEAEHSWGPPRGDGYYQLAELTQRWLGAFLDQIFFCFAVAPAVVVAIALDKSDSLIWATAAVTLVTIVPFGVYQFYLVARGQSLGKRIAKTRVVRLDGSAPGFLYGVVLRNWLFLCVAALPGLGTIAGLVDVGMIFRADRRTARDHIAGTRVIRS
jgi:uncharacterized RDD family membrane protein YckC